MDTLVVEGRHRLEGEVVPAGNKNAALPILAASLLTEEEVVVENVPDIGDVRDMVEILADLGVEVERGDHTVRLRTRDVRKIEPRADLAHRIRGSITLAGSMLARCGRAKIPHPGGDRIGRRRVDTHFLALKALGASVSVGDFHYDVRARGGLTGADILLDEASVTATESALMAASLARGTTVIRNAASEPHVQELCRFLNGLGARISGIGTNTLTVEGVERLRGGTCRLESDYMEVGSFIGLAAATDSELLIRDAVPEHMRMILATLGRLGVEVEVIGQDLRVPRGQRLEVVADLHGAIPKIDDAPWPAFPTDLMSIAVVLATQARGTVLIFERMYENRLFFIDRLTMMGARIVLCDPHRAVIVGPSRLHGATMASPDIRAGMALLIAALCAKGKSRIQNVDQIDRGYERIDERLRALRARIERV